MTNKRPNTSLPATSGQATQATAAANVDPAAVVVPDDFPRDLAPAALSGQQPKVAARLIDGRYVVGLTAEERLGHYLMCQDLVERLLDYHRRRLQDKLPFSVELLVEGFHHTVRTKDWPVTAPEARWIEQRLRQHLQPLDPGHPGQPGQPV